MSASNPSEERYPLLLLFLEDGNRSSKQYKKINFDKNRYQGITSGATAVITQWPGHLTTCWLTSLLIGLMLAFVAMMMFIFSVRPNIHLLSAVCRGNRMYVKDNNSIILHIVHGPSPWLQSQLEFLEEVVQNYQQVSISLILIQNQRDHNCTKHDKYFLNNLSKNSVTETNTLSTPNDKTGSFQDEEATASPSSSSILPTTNTNKIKSNNYKKVKRLKRYISNKKPFLIRRKRFQLSIHIGTKRLLKMLMGRKPLNITVQDTVTESPSAVKTVRSISNLIDLYPNLYVTNLTYQEVFKSSPLRYIWINLNEDTRLFAIRVLQMWEFGGITLNIPEQTTENSNITSLEGRAENLQKFRNLIAIGLTSYKNLLDGLVTVDDEGYHMETKTVCHAFFGELLMGIKKAKRTTMPGEIIKNTLTLFCKRGAVDSDYCQKAMVR